MHYTSLAFLKTIPVFFPQTNIKTIGSQKKGKKLYIRGIIQFFASETFHFIKQNKKSLFVRQGCSLYFYTIN
jgi:hypothetical protein